MAYTRTLGTDAATSTSGTSLNISVTCTTGENLYLLVGYGGSSSLTESISDGVNTFTKVGTTLNDPTPINYAMFEARNVTGGTRTTTFTVSSAVGTRFIWYIRVSGVQNAACQTEKQRQFGPATTADAETSGGALTPSAQPGALIGVAVNTSGVGTVSSGTSFTDDGTLANAQATFGVKTRSEDRRVTSTSATGATFTISAGSQNTDNFAWYIPESGGGTTTDLNPPSPGVVVITGNTPAITDDLNASSGAVTIAGNAPTITANLTPASTGVVVLLGNAPSISFSGVLDLNPPNPGAVTLQGNAPTIDVTGATAQQPAGRPRRRVMVNNQILYVTESELKQVLELLNREEDPVPKKKKKKKAKEPEFQPVEIPDSPVLTFYVPAFNPRVHDNFDLLRILREAAEDEDISILLLH